MPWLHKRHRDPQKHDQQVKAKRVEESAGRAIPVRGPGLHFVGNIRNLTGRIHWCGGDHANLFPFMKLSTQTEAIIGLLSTPFVQGSLGVSRNHNVVAVDVEPIVVGRGIGKHLQRHRPL
jgi:hypothetical protein